MGEWPEELGDPSRTSDLVEARSMGVRTPVPILKVGFVLVPDFTLSALALFIDALRLAGDEGDRSRQIRCTWSVMSNRSEPVRASSGLAVAPTSTLLPPESLDYIVVVGGLLHTRRDVDPALLKYLRSAADAGVSLVGVCTGSFVLARAGLMQGFRCCVSWYHGEDFANEFPGHRPVADRLFVADGARITCSGGTGVADLAAFIIERHLGRSAAQKAMHVLLAPHPRPGSEAQPHSPVAHEIADSRVRRALILMEQNVASPLDIELLASKLMLSPRHLQRLFEGETGRTPAAVYREIRLQHARLLIETTQLSMTDVAAAAGFCDSAHFSRQFKRFFSASPLEARRAARKHRVGAAQVP